MGAQIETSWTKGDVTHIGQALAARIVRICAQQNAIEPRQAIAAILAAKSLFEIGGNVASTKLGLAVGMSNGKQTLSGESSLRRWCRLDTKQCMKQIAVVAICLPCRGQRECSLKTPLFHAALPAARTVRS